MAVSQATYTFTAGNSAGSANVSVTLSTTSELIVAVVTVVDVLPWGIALVFAVVQQTHVGGCARR